MGHLYLTVTRYGIPLMQPAPTGFGTHSSASGKTRSLTGCVNAGLDSSLSPMCLVKSLKPEKKERRMLPVKEIKYFNLFVRVPMTKPGIKQ